MNYGILSILPPIITIGLAFLSKNVFLSLMVGILLGHCILNNFNVVVALNDSLNGVINVFSSSGNTIVIMSILMIGAIIYIIEKSGGITAFVDIMVNQKKIIKSKKGANFFTWLVGLLIFTSGSLSCTVVGAVTRPINDALKVPHEKAAFLVHTTSTPVCVLIPLSGWLAAMIGYLTSGGVEESQAMGILAKSIPLNLYCIISVFGCLIMSLFSLDFGPMKKAEKRAEETGLLDEAKVTGSVVEERKIEIDTDKPSIWNLILPLLVLIVGVITTLFITGKGNLMNGAGMQALLWGVFLSLATCGLLTCVKGIYTFDKFIDMTFQGAKGMISIAAILMLAFAYSPIIKSLGTGDYLSHIFASSLPVGLLPVFVFLLCLLLSFATGTSMGTMGIMSVIAIPMAINLGASIPLVASAIWGGSIFGDHASPISDTTIMSCATTGCNIMDHIKTQMPYCVLYAAITIVGYLVLGFVVR